MAECLYLEQLELGAVWTSPSRTVTETDVVFFAGMTGDYDSVLGMEKDEPIGRFLRKISTGRFQPAGGEPTLSGVAVDVDDRTGLARAVAPLRVGGRLSEALPPFW